MAGRRGVSARLMTGAGIALAAALLVAVNALSDVLLRPARLDLTAHDLYTLSDGTRSVLAKLEEPVTLRLFLSEKLATRLPGISAYARRVRELLEEYRRVAGGPLRAEVIDPEPFSEEEDRALGYGLEGLPFGDGEFTFFFGLVASGPTGEEAVIPFFSPEREEFLEYDLTRLVHQVANPDQKVVGILSTLPIDGFDAMARMQGALPRPWVVLEQIRQAFAVRHLEPDLERVPAEVDVLMLVHPRGLAPRTRYAIDQHVLRGGRALVFVDPASEEQRPAPGQPPDAGAASDTGGLLAAWGLALEPGKVVADLELATRVRFHRDGRAVVVDYPVWVQLGAAQLSADDVVTAKLGALSLASPGRLVVREEVLADTGVSVEPLAFSTDGAALLDADVVRQVTDPEAVLRAYAPAGERMLLAARVTGPVASAFPDGPPAAAEAAAAGADDADGAGEEGADGAGGEAERPAHLAAASSPAHLIVVADADLLADRFWVREQSLLGSRLAIPTSGNGTFVVNALDNLAGSGDLISVRSRGHFTRPFERVERIREQAELAYRAKERELLERLEQTERRLSELEAGDPGEAGMLLTPEQEQAVERFRAERLRIRAELREVRRELRSNIERLEARLKFLNIGGMPLLVGAGGILLGLYRVRRRRRARGAPAA